jgi:hypothetical protein
MFIPQGKALHQNLATSYVLVEALVADLREGGFSGVVEIRLRDTDNHIVFDRGKIAGVIEKRGGAYSSETTVADVAARSKTERGRVSIFSYAIPVAKALAGRMFAETLYVKLSTEFADLEKLINKFTHERDRQWFIEVVADGLPAMIFIDNGRCSVIQAEAIPSEGDLEIVGVNNNLALLQLIKKCNTTGGIFDVFFTGSEEKVAAETPTTEDSQVPAPEIETPIDEPFANFSIVPPLVAADSAIENQPIVSTDFSLHRAPRLSAEQQDGRSAASTNGAQTPVSLPNLLRPVEALKNPLVTEAEIPSFDNTGFDVYLPASDLQELEIGVPNAVRPISGTPKKAAGDKQRDVRILPTRELMALSGENENATADLQMAEIKRLMGEITKAIEDVMRIVEQRDDFPMHLRAGQLKIANQYPFLDPFGAEFEYLEGEIVFVGKVTAEEFIAGVTEALRLAVTSAVQSSASAMRLRSFIVDKLRFIFTRNREDYVACGLHESLEQIAGVQFV